MPPEIISKTLSFGLVILGEACDSTFVMTNLTRSAPKNLTTDTFEATRGCVNDCEFCVVPSAWGRKPYRKPVADVVADIRRHGAREVMFLDLNLVADPGHARALFEALIPLGIRWAGLATTAIARDRELVGLASRSGCRGLLLGFESLVDDSLSDAGKGYTAPADYREVVTLLHSRRIAVQGCFVFGLDHDTADVVDRTARFCVEARIDLPRFAVCTPFPGTPLYRRLEREGRILTRDWDLYDGQHVVFTPARMSVDELREGHERAWRRAYSLPAIFRRVGAATYRIFTILAANIGYRFYARRLGRFVRRTEVGAASPVAPTPARSEAAFTAAANVGGRAR